jgi:hypothetical protein
MSKPEDSPPLASPPRIETQRLPHIAEMNGFIIETTCPDPKTRGGQRAIRWIGIMKSAKDMISALPGHSPSVVDRGPGVLARARLLGLRNGEVQEFNG